MPRAVPLIEEGIPQPFPVHKIRQRHEAFKGGVEADEDVDEQEEVEVAEVVFPHISIQPRAVVIKPADIDVTYAAVLTSWGLRYQARTTNAGGEIDGHHCAIRFKPLILPHF